MDGSFERSAPPAMPLRGEPAWLDGRVRQDLVQPIGGDEPAGVDPRLSETFEAAEFELAKIGGVERLDVDWPKVEGLAVQLLLDVGKDLRCACHYTVSRLAQGGAEGLRQGVATLAALVQRYQGDLHPRRPRGRVSVTQWLAEQLERELPAMAITMTRNEVDEVSDGLARIRDVFMTLELDTEHLVAATESLRHIKLVASDEEREQEVLAAFPEGMGPAGVAMLEQCATLAEGGETPLSLRMRRWALWMASPGVLSAEARDTTTAQADHDALQALLSEQRWSELLAASEQAFLSNPYWLDLSYFSARAAQHAIGEEGRLAVVGELRALLARDPTIVEATDRDGAELASDEARAWLQREVAPRAGSGDDTEASVELPREIEHLLERGQLREAMVHARAFIDVAVGRVRFARSVALANAFKQLGATDQSFLVFRGLHGHLRSMTVKEWEPRLFAACLEGYLSAKRAASGLGPEDEPLLEELSVLDPTAVLGVLPA